MQAIEEVKSIFTTSFGRSPWRCHQQLRQAEAAKKVEESRQANLRIIETYVRQQRGKGEMPPPRIDDPGYGIVTCVQPGPSLLPADKPAVVTDLPMLGGHYLICGNHRYTNSILTYRRWFCKPLPSPQDREECIKGIWKDGRPTLNPVFFTPHITFKQLNEDGTVVEERSFEFWEFKVPDTGD